MTPKSLFNIILKIFGLFFLREIVYTVPQLIYLISNLVQDDTFNGNENYEIASFAFPALLLIFYIFISYLLIFKTGNINSLLKLERGFNQKEFSFNISSPTMLTVALIVIGGIILINEIPNFFNGIFSYFKEKSMARKMPSSNYQYIITPSVRIVLALLIIGERKRIVSFIENEQMVTTNSNNTDKSETFR